MQNKINQVTKDNDCHGYWETIYADNVYSKGYYIHGRVYGYWITQNNSYLNKSFIAR